MKVGFKTGNLAKCLFVKYTHDNTLSSMPSALSVINLQPVCEWSDMQAVGSVD